MIPAFAASRLDPPEFLTRCAGLPLVDARTPGEYAHAHIPGAVNIPLFSDTEHALVGLTYKERGRAQAVLTGLEAVGAQLPQKGRALLDLGTKICFYCARGGMRSGSLAGLAEALGQEVLVLRGGYKAFRRFVLNLFDNPPVLRVLGGKTGSGKTEALLHLRDLGAQVIDLEGLARHRGSAFGFLPGKPQPGRSHFENRLAVALVACDPSRPIWVEDESENLGTVNLPKPFFRHLRNSPLYVLETPDPDRLQRVLRDYGTLPHYEMGAALDRIKKRLGGAEHAKAKAALADNDLAEIARILLAYYDRAYAKQLQDRPLQETIRAASPQEAAERLAQL